MILNTALLGAAPMEAKLDLAAAQGFAGVEVWFHEVAPHLLTDRDVAELERRFAIRVSREAVDVTTLAADSRRLGLPVEGLIPGADTNRRWSGPLDDDLVTRLAETMATGAALGARYLVLPTVAPSGSLQTVAANLAELAPIAREHGLRLGLEPIGQTPLTPTVADALDVLDRTGLSADDAGVVLDAFHFFRARQTVRDLAPLQPEQIVAVQINGALPLPIDALEGGRHRDLPGRGSFDVTGFCSAVLAIGWGGPFAVEVMNPDHFSRPATATCREAFLTASAVLDDAARRCRVPASAA